MGGAGALLKFPARRILPVGNLGEQAARHFEENGEVKVGRMIASIGQRLLDDAARMVTGQFFKNLGKQVDAA